MPPDLLPDFESLGLTEIIRLQDHLSQVLARRFGKQLALAFTDVVGSTAFFARFGNEAGRTLQQRHFDLLNKALAPVGGRIVDTAGDGAFTCFPSVEAAVEAMMQLAKAIGEENATRQVDQQLHLRIGVHFGQVLTDGTVVTGDAVNLCSRITATCDADEIRMSRAAFLELANSQRVRCRPLGAVELKGIPAPIDLLVYEWRDEDLFPTAVRIEETNLTMPLPYKPTVTFGRLREQDGRAANDVVLELPDPRKTMLISRWHFELRRQADGMILRSLSDQVTEVDGQPVPKGREVRVKPGTVVRVGYVMTIVMMGSRASVAASNETMIGVKLPSGIITKS